MDLNEIEDNLLNLNTYKNKVRVFLNRYLFFLI